MSQPPLPPTVRAFLAFRVFFNARFYYPVLAVLFVDLGITLDRYAVLNAVWAASIVLCEVPLGALADRIGRRPLVLTAASLMVVEMAVLAFAPTSDPSLLFALFVVNRALSGLAEAAASGADEAMAYDALAAAGRRGEWPRVLGALQRRMAIAFVATMIVGAAVYDPDVVNAALGVLGLDAWLDQQTTARFPVYLTLGLAFGALAAAFRMRERPVSEGSDRPHVHAGGLAEVWAAARWIHRTAIVAAVIGFGLVLDSVVRLFLTLDSTYYRMIGIPAGLFGILGAAFAAVGFAAAGLAERLVRRASVLTNFGVVTAVVLAGFAGIAVVPHAWAAGFVGLLALGFHLLGFFVSHYLNAATASYRRATVLSFRSLAGNLAYGALGWGYALLLRGLAGGQAPDPGSPVEMALLARTLVWLPVALVVVELPLFAYALRVPRMRRVVDGDDEAGTS